MASCRVLLAIACAGFAAVSVHASAGSAVSGGRCDAADGCGQREDSEAAALLQSAPARAVPASLHGCSTRSLIIGAEVGEETWLQWNLVLMANGADFYEFLNITEGNNGTAMVFETDVEFVKHGKPVFGIVLVRLIGEFNLAAEDAAKLKAYLDAGGMLVVGESTISQINALMVDLGSSIRQNSSLPAACSTPENAPYAPSKTWEWCPYTKGVTGLQSDSLDEVVDIKDSSYPLFHLKESPDFVVGRVEKARSLVVVGDDEPFDDDCATRDDGNNRLAFGPTTNLRFFANLWQQRCRHGR